MPDQYSQPNSQPINQNNQNQVSDKIVEPDQGVSAQPLEAQPDTGAINNTVADGLKVNQDALNLNSAAAEKSPLESSYVPTTPPTQPVAENQITTPPNIDSQPPAVSPEDNEPVKAPDTDEFLKRILEDNPANSEGAAGPTSQSVSSNDLTPQAPTDQVPESPAPTQTQNDIPQSVGQQIPDSGINMPVGETPPAETAENASGIVGQPSQPNKIADATSNLDSIFTQPTAPAPGQGEQVTSDVVGAMQKKTPPPATGSSTKLIGLVVLALILVGGGYFAYNSLFSADDNSSNSGATATQSTTVADVTELTNDEVRKADLTNLQSVLADYWTNENKYPVSTGLEFLNTTGNALEKALVPSYLKVLPTDPDPAKKYAYKSDGTTYTLTAIADDQYDSEAIADGNLYIFKATPDTTLTTSSSISGSSSVGFDSAEASVGSTSTSTSATSTTNTIPSPPVPSEDLVLPE